MQVNYTRSVIHLRVSTPMRKFIDIITDIGYHRDPKRCEEANTPEVIIFVLKLYFPRYYILLYSAFVPIQSSHNSAIMSPTVQEM